MVFFKTSLTGIHMNEANSLSHTDLPVSHHVRIQLSAIAVLARQVANCCSDVRAIYTSLPRQFRCAMSRQSIQNINTLPLELIAIHMY
jgi:hypothetical protein